MKTYIVGGAVRDALLGYPVQDRDYVVVGATPDDMLAQGFLPVGKDFPVFLHPRTHDEYALARTERKTAAGYKGFVFHTDADVTLEQDLIRRDLSINAMAQDDDGHIIDPYGGLQDLKNRVFRHVSLAFCEDPVRILRLARFAARFAVPPQDFSVAEETTTLMQKMVAAGEVDALVAERVWQEISRGLMEVRPSRMFDVLRSCGALQRLLPEIDALPEAQIQHLMQLLDASAKADLPLSARYAVLLHHLSDTSDKDRVKLADAVSQRLKVPAECRDLAILLAREHLTINQAGSMTPADIVDLFGRCDAYRKPERFLEALTATASLYARPGMADTYQPVQILQRALSLVQQVKGGDIASQYASQPQQIPLAIRAARIAMLEAAQYKT
ncbi:multifunctional CCA addition/repair protein [Undibacterium sp. TS12]|uniref:multifunctional CCA addition/repair protein n=1 Tax=Undibacterium sp. TS12 TaxID=2908202 RepID=UPI001F4D2E0C|nr:multifunctional CCA addition/repair protein [Undibacterium sp. TS12]MCH8617582.1 multifunctional CCA addition/repair protein [Undibacterium sp. TS12]